MIELVSQVFGSANLTRYVMFPSFMYGAQRNIISNNFPFYNNLSIVDKRYFEHRVLKFIKSHNFIGRQGLVITKKKEILIASTAVMLTFGMRSYQFSQFDNIVIYPKNYLSRVTKKHHHGEINPRLRTIVFAWDNFMEGIQTENTNLNLGLHELAHAMHFSFMRENSITAMLFLEHFNILLEKMKDVKLQRKIIDSGYLRIYGFKNKYEFLSVLIEHFFETPLEFNEKLPKVYEVVSLMLNLDLIKMSSKASA